MKIIAVASQKGGVAKTTTAVTVSHGLAMMGKRVLLVDVDPQGQCASAMGMQQESGVFSLLVAELPLLQVERETGRDRLQIIPSDRRTSTAQLVLAAQNAPISALASKLKLADHDFIVLDLAPSVGALHGMALWAADWILIPAACDYLSAEGVYKTLETLQSLKNEYNWRGQLFGVLPTFYDKTREAQAIIQNLKDHLGEVVLPPIHRATVLREATASGQTIFEFDPTSRAAKEYGELVKQVSSLERS